MKNWKHFNFVAIIAIVGIITAFSACKDPEPDPAPTPDPNGGSNIPVTGITLFPPTLTLGLGETRIMAASIEPSNATNKNVTWMSDNVTVAEVNANGTVFGLAPGKANIYISTIDGNKTASCAVTVNATINPVNRFRAEGYSLNDNIKYSVSYGNYDYYYIYLGEMKNIPLFSYQPYYHSGLSSSYTVSVTETIKESVQSTVSNSRQTTLGIVDTYTTSKTSSFKLSTEISAKFTLFGIEIGPKVATENYWSTIKTNSSSNSTQLTTSLTDTQTHVTEYTRTTMESRTWPLDQNYKAGYYRYSMFSASDVYLYVIRDRNKPDEIYYEFREHVIPDVYFWMLDYSENPSFNKSDESGFGFDVSLLDNLSPPATDLTPTLASKLDFLQVYAVTGGEYVFEVSANESISPTSLSYSGRTNISITLIGKDGRRIISLSSNGSVFTVENGVTLILDNNITLQGRNNNNASIVQVNNGGTLVMNTGSLITGNTIFSLDYGGGVKINSGAFTMNGGEISGNTVNDSLCGGGVYVAGYGTSTMHNGKISGNSANSGGGVYVGSNGTFTMDGGEISNNTATGSGGGGVYVLGLNGTFTMNGGEIISNNTAGSGGGVFINRGTFIMDNGEISNNTAGSGGGVNSSGNFTMNGGEIYGNSARQGAVRYGGGVYVSSYGTFTMHNGEIYGNSASSGGGVYLMGSTSNSSTFRIVTGTIYGSNESVTSLRNLVSGAGAALALNINSTAQRGYFNGSTWVSRGDLNTTNDTIKVLDGNLQ